MQVDKSHNTPSENISLNCVQFSTPISDQENISTFTSTLPEHSNDTILCGILKTQNFNSSDGPKLEERLTNFQDSDKFGKIQKKLACFLGYGRNETLTIPEIVDRLLPRNYPELENFDGTQKLVIFVPEWYLTKAVKYADPSRCALLRQHSEDAANACPERKRHFETMKKFYLAGERTMCGDKVERNLYNILQDRFKKRDESVVVFHGIDILKMNLDRAVRVSEKDFVIISATYQYVMVIEVKKTLGAGESVEKSTKQLREAKLDMEAWFDTEGLHNWKYIPLIVTENITTTINCGECKKYIIEGMLF